MALKFQGSAFWQRNPVIHKEGKALNKLIVKKKKKRGGFVGLTEN